MSKGKRTNKFGGLSYNDPINKIRRLKAKMIRLNRATNLIGKINMSMAFQIGKL